MAGSTFEPQAGAKSPAVPAAVKSATDMTSAQKSEKRSNMQMIPKVSIYDEPQFSHVLYNLGMTIG